jgi:hypothetical protein
MNKRQVFLKMVVSLSLVLILAGAAQVPQPAWASMEDAAIFYEELNQYGEWVEDETHGPMWYPTKVQENWRPYVDGRWTPADEGYVFETQEPWGWATYHYGNWMPTEEYGWVWVPGRTWYPNTVSWRTSSESESPDESYVGWAPIPPPNYTPQPGYYPEGYYGGAPYRGPSQNLITEPFWIFVKAAGFLLGFAQPYAPSYSYWGCNCLVPPPVVPYYYNRTVVVHNYYTPRYYPVGYLAAGRGYYNWGPPIPYVARVTKIKQENINNYVKQVNIYQRRNVVPPPNVMARRAHFRDVMPPAMVKHHPLPRGVRVRDTQVARRNLARPNLVNAKMIKNAPPIRATMPKTRMIRAESGQWRRGVPGSALPASAMMRPNHQMENHLRKIPSSRRIDPVSPRARKWQAPQTPGAAAVQPAAFQKRRGPEVTPATPGSPPVTAPRAAPQRPRPGVHGEPQAGTPGQPGPSQKTMGRPGRPQPRPEGITPGAPGTTQASTPPERFKRGKQQPSGWNRREQTPQAGVTPGQPPIQEQKPRYTPGTPPSRGATPAQVQPQPRPQSPRQEMQRTKRKSTPEKPQSFEPRKPEVTGAPPPKRQYHRQTPRQVRQQPPTQPQPQVRQQPRRQPQPQVRQQPRPQPQRQVRQQPRPQQRPQARRQPPPSKKQQQKKQKNQQD